MGDEGVLARLYLGQQQGRDVRSDAVVPSHLLERDWTFICDCGVTWHAKADAVTRDGQVAAPRRPCTACHAWVLGRLVPI